MNIRIIAGNRILLNTFRGCRLKSFRFTHSLKPCGTAIATRVPFFQCCSRHFSSTLLRSANEASSSWVGPKLVIPARLLIFHAGTPAVVLVGLSRLVTLLFAAYSVIFVVPATLYNPDASYLWLLIPAIVIGGTLPLLLTSYATAPFTSMIHLNLPSHARISREALIKFIKTASFTTTVDITTMRFIGSGYLRREKIGNLEPLVPTTMRLANLGIVGSGAKMLESRAGGVKGRTLRGEPLVEQRPWWRMKPTTKFWVGTNRLSKPQLVYWPEIIGRIMAATEARKGKANR